MEKEKVRSERRLEAAAKLFGASAPDEVVDAWLKVVIKKALPLSLFDDSDFRKAVLTTARCGKNFIASR